MPHEIDVEEEEKEMSASKKPNFREAMAREPATMFISKPAEEEREPAAEAPAPRSTPQPGGEAASIMEYVAKHTEKREVRSRRLQILLKPSLYERLKASADRAEISVNELVNAMVERALDTME